MLHKLKVFKALKGNAIRQTRILLGIKSRPKAPVASQPVERVIEHHSMICRRLMSAWPEELDIHGGSVCEIGPGDCLASAAFFLGKGASHVDLVELQPPVINEKQFSVLSALKDEGIPINLDILHRSAQGLSLNTKFVTYWQSLIEHYEVIGQHDLVFSHHVLEHVEDLVDMFGAVYRALRPGGRMLQMVDLGGHGEFEHPVPPLDFQTYPDWLFAAMYPTHHRCTRRFLSDYKSAAAKVGFKRIEINPMVVAETSYVRSIRNRLRPSARREPVEDIAVIEFSITAIK